MAEMKRPSIAVKWSNHESLLTCPYLQEWLYCWCHICWRTCFATQIESINLNLNPLLKEKKTYIGIVTTACIATGAIVSIHIVVVVANIEATTTATQTGHM